MSNQSIEPTQLAGFNQFCDDQEGTASTRYGFGLDQILPNRIYTGFKLSWRDLASVVENLATGGARKEEQDEERHRAYLYWTPTESVALAAEYEYEGFDRAGSGGVNDPDSLKTHYVPLTINYHRLDGWFGKLAATFVDQDVEFEEEEGIDRQDEAFWEVDASLGYRLPKRFGIIAVEVRNLLDQNFNPEEPQLARFQSDRSIFIRINLWYY